MTEELDRIQAAGQDVKYEAITKSGIILGLDADSEGEEGKFYVWSPSEVIDVLGETNGERFNRWFDVTPAGLISAIITESGVARPPYEESLREAYEAAQTRSDAARSTSAAQPIEGSAVL